MKMSFRRYTLIAAIGVVLVVVLFAATANVAKTGDSSSTGRETAVVLPNDFAGHLPPIQIFPPR
jgi:hypothetical protein